MRHFIFNVVLIGFISVLTFFSILAQAPNPCFGPDPATHPVLYISNQNCPDHNPDFDIALLGFTNFEPVLNGFAGNWTIEAASTASASFASDPNNPANTLDSGSSASLNVTSPGSLVVTNTIDDFTTSPPSVLGSCTQTYTVECYVSDIEDNPPFEVDCPTRILLLLDESGSIETDGATATVESAVTTLVSEIATGDSELAIIEFESVARPAAINGSTAFQLINAAFMAGLNTYLTAPSSLPNLTTGDSNPQDPNSYTPGEDVDAFIGATNWEDALLQANASGGADIVIFLTDGNPTFYNDPTSGATGEGNILDMTALVQARDAANLLKSGGSHLFFIGLGDVLTQPIIESSGAEQYLLGSSAEAFCTADYFSLSASCPNIESCMTEIGNQIVSKQDCCIPAPPVLIPSGVTKKL